MTESRDRMARILNRMSTFYALLSPDGKIVEVNDAALVAAGVRREDLLGTALADTVFFAHDPASRAEVLRSIARARAGESVRVELSGQFAAHVLVIDARFEPILDDEGRVAEIVASGVDTTAQHEARRAGLASEQRARALVDNSLDLILVVSLDGKFRMVSPSVEAIGGYRVAELIGSSAFALVHPDDLPAAAAKLAEISMIPNAAASMAIRFRHADGSYRSLQMVGRNLIHVPAIGGVLLNGRDVTDQLATEAMLRQAEKLEALGHLAGGIAHDFNNLLTVVLANAEMILEWPSEPPAELAAEIRSAARRATDLTSQLLLFSRRDSGVRRSLDLHEVLGEVLALAARSIDRRITVEPRLEAARSLVIGDPTSLQGAFLNLAINARDAMPRGGRLSFTTRNVTLDADDVQHWPDPLEPGPYLELTVSDTGDGIPEAIRARVFEPFFTTKAPGKGTGLGLAGVRGCMRAHLGSVRLDTAASRGSTFQLVLPSASSRPVTANPAPREAITGDAWVLVIDDEEAIRRATTRALVGAGYHVDSTDDADHALGRFAEDAGCYDVVVLDVNLPGRSGIELFHAIRAVSPVAVMFCSGHAREGIPPEVFDDRRVSFIAKPFTIEELTGALAHALGGERPPVGR